MVDKIITALKKMQLNRHIKSVSSFINIGNSHLVAGFRLTMHKPVPGKTFLKVGDNSMLSCNVVFETSSGEVVIGDNCFIGAGHILSISKVEIGDNVFVAWGGYIYDHDSHSLDYKLRQDDITQQLIDYRAGKSFIENKNWGVVNSKPIKICSNVWIGMNCTILKGVTIGEGAIVAAGSIVTKDVAPWTVVAGNPAREVKKLPTP